MILSTRLVAACHVSVEMPGFTCRTWPKIRLENGFREDKDDEITIGHEEEHKSEREDFTGEVMSELETTIPTEKQEEHAVHEHSDEK